MFMQLDALIYISRGIILEGRKKDSFSILNILSNSLNVSHIPQHLESISIKEDT